jgi:hypothetical protein
LGVSSGELSGREGSAFFFFVWEHMGPSMRLWIQ